MGCEKYEVMGKHFSAFEWNGIDDRKRENPEILRRTMADSPKVGPIMGWRHLERQKSKKATSSTWEHPFLPPSSVCIFVGQTCRCLVTNSGLEVVLRAHVWDCTGASHVQNLYHGYWPLGLSLQPQGLVWFGFFEGRLYFLTNNFFNFSERKRHYLEKHILKCKILLKGNQGTRSNRSSLSLPQNLKPKSKLI